MKVIYKKTNVVIVDDCRTLAEAQGVVRVCVMFTNERIKRGIQTGKRENKNDYLITDFVYLSDTKLPITGESSLTALAPVLNETTAVV